MEVPSLAIGQVDILRVAHEEGEEDQSRSTSRSGSTPTSGTTSESSFPSSRTEDEQSDLPLEGSSRSPRKSTPSPRKERGFRHSFNQLPDGKKTSLRRGNLKDDPHSSGKDDPHSSEKDTGKTQGKEVRFEDSPGSPAGQSSPGEAGTGIAQVTTLKRQILKVKKKFNFNRTADSIRVEEQLQLPHLKRLLWWFEHHTPPSPPPAPRPADRLPRREPGLLNAEEFRDVLAKVLGTHEYDNQLDNLFAKLDTSLDGYVDWGELCTYLLLQLRENDYLQHQNSRPVQAEPRIRHVVFNRQEPTSKIVAIDSPLRYVTTSKEGVICIWNNNFHLEKHLSMSDGDDDPRAGKRLVKMWVTDVVYMPNARNLVIATTGRDLRFFDATSGQFNEEFHLYGINDVPTCLEYWYDAQNPNTDSFLMYGEDDGAINILTFSRPVSQLFEQPFKKEPGAQKVYMPEIHMHHKWVKHTQVEGIHPERVHKLRYLPDNGCTISCCLNPRQSLVIHDIFRNKKTYTFNLTRGVECFDHNKSLNVLVTGSADHIVRLWNPYVPSRAVGVLQGHSMGVIDVAIHAKFSLVISYSKDMILKIWDLKEHTCLQTVVLKFPASLHGRMPEHGPFPLLLQPPPYNALLVASADYVAVVKLGETRPAVSLVPTTHQTQLSGAIYNPHFKLVVTGADDSTVGIWDLDTGMKSMMINNAHNTEEITCLVFDSTWRRLITGARNGTIKVWNVQNGHNLHQLEAVSEAEVTGLVPLTDHKAILAVGWSRQITVYDDSSPDNVNVKVERSWKGGRFHRDDILAVAHLPQVGLMATASFDGEINIWSLETENLYLQLRKGQPPKVGSESAYLREPSSCQINSRLSTPASRPNSRHRNTHQPPKGVPAPVDKLLFLPARARQVKRPDGALLVSSEAGVLRWWSIYGNKHELGDFYAAGQADESVLGLSSDAENHILVTGDTQGQVAVWDIADYCTQQTPEKTKCQPDLKFNWSAHDSALVSVEYLVHDRGVFVVSASTDKTAKLWTIDGQCVGIFGQKNAWDLRHPSTWITSLQVEEPEETSKPTDENGDQPDSEGENGNKDNSKIGKEEVVETMNKHDQGTDTLKVSVPAPASPSPSSLPSLTNSHSGIMKGHKESPTNNQLPQRKVTIRPVTMDTLHHSSSEFLDSSSASLTRSHTFAFESKTSQNILGQKAKHAFARQQRDRAGRRDMYGEVNPEHTRRLDNICTPYQALATQTLDDIQLPAGLPVTQRMMSRGYTPSNLNQSVLQSMDLSLFPDPNYLLDTHRPPGGTSVTPRRDGMPQRLPNIKKGRNGGTSLNNTDGKMSRRKTSISSHS